MDGSSKDAPQRQTDGEQNPAAPLTEDGHDRQRVADDLKGFGIELEGSD
jgi:hypothetical protein